jgi:hypothetical protein
MPVIKRMFAAAFAVLASVCLASGTEAADRLRIAIQKTGTASWEIEVIKARGLDKAANLDIETTELLLPTQEKTHSRAAPPTSSLRTGFGRRANGRLATSSCSRPIRACLAR